MTLDENLFSGEVEVVRILRAALGPDTPIVMTTFPPFHQIVRRAGLSSARILFAHRDATLRMLDVVSDGMCRFMVALRDAGCDGVFLAVTSGMKPPSPLAVDDTTFETFMQPYERAMLDAMGGMKRMLHVHGEAVDVARVLDYPIECLSVSDRLCDNPSLAQLREMTDSCLMGGVNEQAIVGMTPDELRAEIDDAIAVTGGQNFILSPGCTMPSWTPAHLLRILAGQN